MVFSGLPDCPTLEVGDWLLFPNCGAYSAAGATDFNGIPATFQGGVRAFYIRAESHATTEGDAGLALLYSPIAPLSVKKNY